MLRTLAYRIPDAQLGTVVAYPLSTEFAYAFAQLPKASMGTGAKQVQPPYKSLAAALRAVSNRPVRLIGDRNLSGPEPDGGTRALLLTTKPIDPWQLATAISAWERRVRNGRGDESLAALLPEPETARPLAQAITRRDGCPVAPGWVFDTASWEAGRRLSAHPLAVDGRDPIVLRLDTEGALLGWHDLVSHGEGQYEGHAMMQVVCQVVTIPGITELVLRFDAHLTRLDRRWNGVRSAWIERDALAGPVLRLGVRSFRRGDGWVTEPSDHTSEVVQACQLGRLDLPAELENPAGRVRAIVPKSRWHPVGKGLGARLMLRLAEHIEQHLPGLTPVAYGKTAISVTRPSRPVAERHGLSFDAEKTSTDKHKRVRDALPPAVVASGHARLRLVLLYATVETRQRMASALESWIGTRTNVLDDTPVDVTDEVTAVFHHLPDHLQHGTAPTDKLLTDAPFLRPEHGVAVAALLETEWTAGKRITDDVKPLLRRFLAGHGVVTQFLAHAETGGPRKAGKTRDFAADAALRDLLRGTGVIDHRFAVATAREKLPHRLARPVTLVGLHARAQPVPGASRPNFVTTAVAMQAHPRPSDCWPLRMFSDRRGWTTYAQAVTDFHAGPIGSNKRGRYGAVADPTRDYVAGILDALEPDGPVIVFVDTEGWRTIFAGLQNQHLGREALPGDNLKAAGRDVAVVRINTGNEVPRPLTRVAEGSMPGDPRQPSSPGAYLYSGPEGPVPSWLLAGSSRTYRSKGGQVGAHYTRWTLPDNLAREREQDWHAYRAVEITVVQTGSWSPEPLAALTGRLCDQAPAWDDRTSLPAPLHLAQTADHDHPEFRRNEET